jgi:deazaflavin-dependent oxidoreductase (nitroreductase family)
MSPVPEGEREGVPAGSPPRRTEQPATHPPKELHRGWLDRAGDAAFRTLARLGFGPASLLTTTGRRTGQSRRTPVIPVRQEGRLWLVAPYGEVSWVLNARATGQVELRHGRHANTYTIREAAASEAGPVLKQYVEVASATRPYFLADRSAPVSTFVAEAHLHPVFELIATDGGEDLPG